jgi:hypothetical protein
MHLGERLPQPGRLAGEIATRVRDRLRGIGQQRAYASGREFEAVRSSAQELLQHRQLQDLSVEVDLDPAVEGGDALHRSARQHFVDLDVGIHARTHLAEDLHDGGVIEADR